MKITILGMSSIGISYALLFASFDHEVIAFDFGKSKIDCLKQGIPLSQEKDLKEMLVKWKERVNFCSDIEEALNDTEIIFIACDTFENSNGDADLDEISNYINEILDICRKKVVIVLKSYAPVGTIKQIEKILNQHRLRHDIVLNPEFARNGTLVNDIFYPDRVIVGVNSAEIHLMMSLLYSELVKRSTPIIFTSLESAEMIKYASDHFLSLKLSYINEIALFCDKTGADIDVVSKGLGYDPRIGPLYLKASAGYGGLNPLKKINYSTNDSESKEILEMCKVAENINKKTPKVFAKRIIDRFINELDKITVAVLGLSYKGETSDINNSPSFIIIDTLLKNNVRVIAYDKYAESDFSKMMYKHKKLKYASELKVAVKYANCIVIANDAKEFKKLTVDTLIKLMPTKPVVFDGKNLFNPVHMSSIEYHSIGRSLIHKYAEKGPNEE